MYVCISDYIQVEYPVIPVPQNFRLFFVWESWWWSALIFWIGYPNVMLRESNTCRDTWPKEIVNSILSSYGVSTQRNLTAKKPHSTEASQQRNYTAKKSHSKEISQQRSLTAEKPHCKEITRQRSHTAKKSHDREASLQRSLTAKKPHSKEITQQRNLTAETSHCKEVPQQRSLTAEITAKKSHSKEIPQQRSHTSKTSHSKDATQHRSPTAKKSHSKEVTLQRRHTAKTPRSTEVPLQRRHTAKKSHSKEIQLPLLEESLAWKLCFPSSTFTFEGMSRTKASFSHLQLWLFEGCLARKFFFFRSSTFNLWGRSRTIFFHNFHFQFWREVSHESFVFTSWTCSSIATRFAAMSFCWLFLFLIPFIFLSKFLFQKLQNRTFSALAPRSGFGAGFGPENSWDEVRRAVKSWDQLRWCEKSWSQLRRCAKRREEMRRHEVNWEELRTTEKMWEERDELEKPRWHEMGWQVETTWHEKSWEGLSWDKPRRMEKLRGTERRRIQMS